MTVRGVSANSIGVLRAWSHMDPLNKSGRGAVIVGVGRNTHYGSTPPPPALSTYTICM